MTTSTSAFTIHKSTFNTNQRQTRLLHSENLSIRFLTLKSVFRLFIGV